MLCSAASQQVAWPNSAWHGFLMGIINSDNNTRNSGSYEITAELYDTLFKVKAWMFTSNFIIYVHNWIRMYIFLKKAYRVSCTPISFVLHYFISIHFIPPVGCIHTAEHFSLNKQCYQIAQARGKTVDDVRSEHLGLAVTVCAHVFIVQNFGLFLMGHRHGTITLPSTSLKKFHA